MILRGLLTLPLVSGVAATCARAPAAAPRKVRYWLGMGTGGRDIVDRTTNASCSVEVIGNLTLLHPAIDSLGIEMWELSSSGISWTSTGNVPDRGLYACIAQIHATFPSIAVGLCGSATQGGVDIAAANITTFTATLSTFIGQVAPTGSISELWTDWELKSLSASQTAGANAAHAAMQALLPTYRYAGCESRDAPYLSENCSAFVAAAPGVTVQAANTRTYWSTAKKDVGWYKGFDTLLDQEIVNIGGAVNIAVLSPSICPDCATGASNDSLSVKDLRARMDYVCAKGITDFSVFTFFELVERRVGGGFGIGAKYFEALAYFRTGVKGLIVSDSDTEEAAGSSAQLQVKMKEKKVSVKGNDGPCDIYAKSGTPCVAAHSVARALFSDYTGALYEVERKSDYTALRINVLSAGGVADAAAQDKFCNGTDCMIIAIFDQSELGNHLGTNKTMLQHGGLGRQPWGEVSGVNASKRSVLLMGGAKVYAAVFEGKMGYRNNTAKGVASGDEGETIYMVAAGDHYNDRCCFDYGNAERSMSGEYRMAYETALPRARLLFSVLTLASYPSRFTSTQMMGLARWKQSILVTRAVVQ